MTVNPVPSTAADKTAVNKTAVDDKTAINKTVDSTAQSGRIMCCYVNETAKLQVVRISNIPDYFFERVVFAGQQLLIDVDSEAVLEIHSHELASAIVSDRIPCQQLRYAEPLLRSQATNAPVEPSAKASACEQMVA